MLRAGLTLPPGDARAAVRYASPMVKASSLPRLFKRARKALGWSLGDVQKHLNVHANTWWKWESAQRRPPAAAIGLALALEWAAENGQLDELMEHFDRNATWLRVTD